MLLEEVGKRLCNLREILNESSAIACKTKKTAELLDILRRFPIQNCGHLLGVNSDAFGGDDVTKEKNFIKPKLTFGELCIELILSKLVEHQSQMFGMILLILGEDQDIIEIHQDEFIGIGVEDEIHHPREHWRSIDKAERHDNIFIRTKACSECCLGNIFFTNANLMITHTKVKLGEHFSTFELLE